MFGTPTDLPWGLEIASPAYRPEAYPDAATFHPTFLYESLWNIGVVFFLLWMEKRFEMRRGRLFAMYMVLYGIIRFLLELMRTDTTFRFLGLSRNGWVALGVGLAGGFLFWWLRGPRDGPMTSMSVDRCRRRRSRGARSTRSEPPRAALAGPTPHATPADGSAQRGLGRARRSGSSGTT